MFQLFCNEFLIVFQQKQVILARALEAQNQKKVMKGEIAEIEDKSTEEKDNYLN